MTKKLRTRVRLLCDDLFSSMSFGGIFGTWIIITTIVAIKKGWGAAGICLTTYLMLWLGVAVIGGLMEEKHVGEDESSER